MKAKTILTSTASLGLYLGAVLCLVSTTVSSPHPVQLPLIDGTAPPRNMQQSSSTDFLYLNFASVLQSIEDHLRSAPVQRNIHRLFQSRVQFGGEEHSYPSVQYTFDGFWSSWKDNMQNKLLIAGDNIERNMTVKVYSDRGKRLPDQAIIISGFEYGLANMAAFLAQAMVDGIYSDECSVLSSMAENQCSSLSEKERWAIPIKSWQKVQDYSNSNWDYKQQLVDYVDRGMNRLEYNPDHRKIDYGFIQSVSGVYQSGCHDVDSEGKIGSCPSSSSGLVGKMSQRRTAFATALSALCIPRLREIEIVKTTLEYLKGRKGGFVDNLLLYKRGEDLYPSQRYQFDDMVSAIEVFSIPSNVTMPTVDETKKYFQSPDHQAFYMGDPYMQYGHKYGLGNIALFFANGLHLSIEKDDACDEQNEHEVYGKLPISNSCGQYEVSYQDMVCSDASPNMACTVDENMELTAVTFGRLIGSPPPLTCAPKSQIKYTGFWNSELVREEKFEAYANQHGRVDVSGCCWWGRGVLQTKGVCAFGRLNHYIGASAKNLGQQSLFPTIDFCTNPEAICSSIYSRELTWMSGLFLWIDQVQPYDQGDFNYMNELHEFADSGFRDEDFIIKTNNIVKFGCHNPPCQNSGCMGSTLCLASSSSDEDTGNFVTKAYRTFMEVDLWSFPDSEGGSNMPSPSPTRCKVGCTKEPTFAPFNPTSTPSTAPVVDPTQSPTASPFSEGDERMEYFLYVKMILDNKKEEIEKEIFTTPNIPIFTFDGFLEALEYVSTIEPEGLVFFLGKDRTSNLGHGLANIALFLAHASTRGLRLNTCEEKVYNSVNDMCPMPIAAMECPTLVDSSTKRGILLNQSPCDIGRLTYIFGNSTDEYKREFPRYNFDFCLRPQLICNNTMADPSESVQDIERIKYLLGLIEWIDRVQTYSWGYWDYIERLKMFVDDGMNDYSFVDTFSKMVVDSVADADLRKASFKALLHILFSEWNTTPPSPPYDFEDNSPSTSPFILSKPPNRPAQTSNEAENESSLSANTRVDLTNNSPIISWSFYSVISILLSIVL